MLLFLCRENRLAAVRALATHVLEMCLHRNLCLLLGLLLRVTFGEPTWLAKLLLLLPLAYLLPCAATNPKNNLIPLRTELLPLCTEALPLHTGVLPPCTAMPPLPTLPPLH